MHKQWFPASAFSLGTLLARLALPAARRPDYGKILYRLGGLHRPRGSGAETAAWYRRFLAARGDPGLQAKARRRLRELGLE